MQGRPPGLGPARMHEVEGAERVVLVVPAEHAVPLAHVDHRHIDPHNVHSPALPDQAQGGHVADGFERPRAKLRAAGGAVHVGAVLDREAAGVARRAPKGQLRGRLRRVAIRLRAAAAFAAARAAAGPARAAPPGGSHAVVLGAAGALGDGPADEVAGGLDVAVLQCTQFCALITSFAPPFAAAAGAA
eukprot:CAMPEP_0172170538 /NCGR_PEP_ID=MMETSP1050-20130122/11332_1 /TAXON_ID=233186 /ORGANISM="Cryptomonas curvata, Strain CCAP979/52" /LENGTH=187 /DNA_ID=CAMNT_0012841749 /DNA_START=72 /DNA_END=633 /DNA_ORIENTATION=+